MAETLHNPDRYMSDLRQILSLGRKRIGLLIGAGAPTAIRVNKEGKLDPQGDALIPDVSSLTKFVLDSIDDASAPIISAINKSLTKAYGKPPNIEAILSRVRLLSQAIGSEKVHGLNADGYDELGKQIANLIGQRVSTRLPEEQNPYSELVSWVGGTTRECPVEVFTPNYDLLFEEAFERASLPYFDGFTGGHAPFFDPPSVANDILPPRWSRLWKIHGSLGWEIKGEGVVRTGSRNATEMIYPDHLKYDKIQRMPYSALFSRLRSFLRTPDCLLICSGFSFNDAHISDVISESLTANPHAAVFAFQFHGLKDEPTAVKIAHNRPNLSIYAKDGAVISGVKGEWRCGQNPTRDWPEIRNTFWGRWPGEKKEHFLLGDFAHLARFCSLAQAVQLAPTTAEIVEEIIAAVSESGKDATK